MLQKKWPGKGVEQGCKLLTMRKGRMVKVHDCNWTGSTLRRVDPAKVPSVVQWTFPRSGPDNIMTA